MTDRWHLDPEEKLEGRRVAELQEGPDALLHPSVRDWEPAPYPGDAEYDLWVRREMGHAKVLDAIAAAFARTAFARNEVAVRMEPPPKLAVPVDPGLFVRTPYLDEVRRHRPPFRT